jgi:hypothetical protein
MLKSPWVVLLGSAALLASVACSSDPGTDQPTDGGVTSDGPPDGPCPEGTLCLKPFLVQPEQPGTAGRLVVVWFQTRDIWNPNPMEVAFDAPFVPGASRYELPLAQIKPPVTDQVLLCQWENDTCLRTANPPAIGLGLPLVLDDTNANGRIDPTELTLYGNHGVGMAYLAWSAAAHAPGDPALAYQDGDPTYLGDIFANGIGAGVHSYPLVMGTGFDDRLGKIDTASGADLALCPTQGTSCQIQPPRLVGSDQPR